MPLIDEKFHDLRRRMQHWVDNTYERDPLAFDAPYYDELRALSRAEREQVLGSVRRLVIR